MGIFNNIFKSQRDVAKEEIKDVPWHILNSTEQLDTIVEESKSQPVAIFKHSTRCGISRMVLKSFERSYTEDQVSAKLYMLDLLNHRDISNEIAERFQVFHESPQLVVISNGEVKNHASHQDISIQMVE